MVGLELFREAQRALGAPLKIFRRPPRPKRTVLGEGLYLRLGTFRLSDKQVIKRALNDADGPEAVFWAVTQFVEVWEKSDWLEAYSVERIGKWIAKNAPSDLVERFVVWAKQKKSKARAALRTGFDRGSKERQTSQELVSS